MSEDRTIKVGVLGVGRGYAYARGAGAAAGMQLVALCDTWEERLHDVSQAFKVAAYTDFDAFLEQDMDAVVLANYFHQHTPFAIRALEAGKHVLCETSACFTLAEAVSLVRAVERSGKIYMFAENYPYMVFNQEMRRLFAGGEIGDFLYGEGEYVHPFSAWEYNSISPAVDHWRNWLPPTYYCTHALAPVMSITDTWPAKVNGFVIPRDDRDPHMQRTARVHDQASMIALRMDNGAVVKLLQYNLRGEGNWVRIHGNRGLMENLRHTNTNMVRIRKEPWEKGEGEPTERIYAPDFPHHHAEATRTGHGGGDFFINYDFAQAIRSGQQPFLDVYRGVAMSIVGILAWRSALNDSAPFEVPDLRNESARAAYENDDWNPDPTRPNHAPSSIKGVIEPTEDGIQYARSVWQDQDALLFGNPTKER